MTASRTVLVTGFTMGIGKGIATALARDTYKVVLTVRGAVCGVQAALDALAQSPSGMFFAQPSAPAISAASH